MKKILSLVIIFLFFNQSFAGHHFDSELARRYPQLDLTDIFVFKSATPNKTVFIMAFNPKSQKNSFENYATNGIFDLNVFNVGEEGNIFHMLPSTVIVLEMPNKMLPNKLYYYASTSVEEEPNHWHRVNRIAYVLYPYLYLLDNKLKISYLNSFHQEDENVKQAIYNNVLNYVTLAGIQKNPVDYTNNLLKKIYPDVLTYDLNTDAVYSVFKINGRPLNADAMDVALALLIGSDTPIDDKVSVNQDRFKSIFPYVVPIDDEGIK